MREIKFRAWNGKYILDAAYGDWVSFDGVPYTEASKTFDTPNIEIEKAKGYTLMQFTGLLDKNGKEIYEGDIITRYHLIGSVAYHNKRAMFIMQDGFNEPLFNEIISVEVIGNIYENPELLKEY